MIISLHTPKSGGTSFKELLETHFGDKFRGDYLDIPINKPVRQRISEADAQRKHIKNVKKLYYKVRGVQCIHGHFLPYKYSSYLNDPKVQFVTWLREPLERLGSHYHYWVRSYQPNSAPLHKKVVEEKWTFEQFCFSEEMKNLYAQFLYEFPIQKFGFIGITEHFDQDMEYFASKILGISDFVIPQSNRNPEGKGSYFDDPDMVRKLKEFHSKDYEIYHYALEQRSKRS